MRDDWAFDLEVRVAPHGKRVAIATPLVADADAADESETTVDDQQLSMRPVIEPRELQKPKNFNLDARSLQEVHRMAMQAICAKGILQKVHLHAGPRALRALPRTGPRSFLRAE